MVWINEHIYGISATVGHSAGPFPQWEPLLYGFKSDCQTHSLRLLLNALQRLKASAKLLLYLVLAIATLCHNRSNFAFMCWLNDFCYFSLFDVFPMPTSVHIDTNNLLPWCLSCWNMLDMTPAHDPTPCLWISDSLAAPRNASQPGCGCRPFK